MTYETIDYEIDDSAAVITLKRPEVLNAQNEAMKDELADAFRAADADVGVRVVVLRGAGRAFSSGHDLKSFPRDPLAFGAPSADKWFEGDTEMVRRIFPRGDLREVHGGPLHQKADDRAGAWLLHRRRLAAGLDVRPHRRRRRRQVPRPRRAHGRRRARAAGRAVGRGRAKGQGADVDGRLPRGRGGAPARPGQPGRPPRPTGRRDDADRAEDRPESHRRRFRPRNAPSTACSTAWAGERATNSTSRRGPPPCSPTSTRRATRG